MNIVSYMEDGKDVFALLIEEIKNQRILSLKEDVLMKRIRAVFKRFLLYQHPDGTKIKCVEGSIFEMRIQIGGTGYLGRIFFHREKDKIIVLTGCLLKPQQYGDKKTIAHIDAKYTHCIRKSHQIVQDYHMTSQKYEYGFISLSST